MEATRARKRALRQQLRDRLAAVAQTRAVTAGQELTRWLVPELPGAGLVGLYAPMGREISTEPLDRLLRARGVTLCYPRVETGSRRLQFHVVADLAGLRPGFHDIREPAPDAPQVAPQELDLCLVPGLAFDRTGRRLGRGGGYYDRLLGAVDRPRRCVGLAYSFQVVAAVPWEDHDHRVDLVATEVGLVTPDTTPLPAGSGDAELNHEPSCAPGEEDTEGSPWRP